MKPKIALGLLAALAALAFTAAPAAATTQNFSCGVLSPGDSCAYGAALSTNNLQLTAKYAGSPSLWVCPDISLSSTFSTFYSTGVGKAWSSTNYVKIDMLASHTYYVRVRNCDSASHTVTGTVTWF